MRILFAGIMGRYPYGGVCWCSLMYLLGLRALGHEVFYLEDTGECNFDPIANTLAKDPHYALNVIRKNLYRYDLGGSWCYIDYEGYYHGCSKTELREYCRSADLFINLSGGSWFWRDEYTAIPSRIFIDSDPAFTQLSIDRGPPWYREFFANFTALFTFGSNVGTDYALLPPSDLTWHHTWQPIYLDAWRTKSTPESHRFTTVMSWTIKSFEDIGGNKDQEFLKILGLPERVDASLELAVNGPRELLASHGWACVDALTVSHDIIPYRDYIQTSYAEFSVAKHTYVETRSGWFSDRSECYLAASRPVVVQDTGFSRTLPTGEGILAFSTMDEAVSAIETVRREYDKHGLAAREIARTIFASDVVLPLMLGRAGV